jgi:signal transduction histidine kinase
VFEPFQRGENALRTTKGAGLGLAICKHLIEAHGGTIWVQEHLGPGTLMAFTVPIARDHSISDL